MVNGCQPLLLALAIEAAPDLIADRLHFRRQRLALNDDLPNGWIAALPEQGQLRHCAMSLFRRRRQAAPPQGQVKNDPVEADLGHQAPALPALQRNQSVAGHALQRPRQIRFGATAHPG